MPTILERIHLKQWFSTYETQKLVRVHSWRLAALYRTSQLTIILYVGLWVMWRQRGYQSHDHAISGSTAKVKGVAFTDAKPSGQCANFSADNCRNKHEGSLHHMSPRVWDVADYVIPSHQNSAFFVATNFVVTRRQKQTTCPEAVDVHVARCRSDADCPAGRNQMLGSGVNTGRCVNSTLTMGRSQPSSTKPIQVCEIFGWCPTENDQLNKEDGPLLNVENFTVLVKNSIQFKDYGKRLSNILPWMDRDYLHRCRYDPKDETMKACPVFRLGDILTYSSASNLSPERRNEFWARGGLLYINVEWDCDFDWSKPCIPEYSMGHLYEHSKKAALPSSYNFRYSEPYYENQVWYRDLIKVYGVQCIITVSATGRKFDALTFTMNLGSGLALLGLATVVCDIIAKYIGPNKPLYRMYKTEDIDWPQIFLRKLLRESTQETPANSEFHVSSTGDLDLLYSHTLSPPPQTSEANESKTPIQ